jgi:hypothetical protein
MKIACIENRRNGKRAWDVVRVTPEFLANRKLGETPGEKDVICTTYSLGWGRAIKDWLEKVYDETSK